MHNVPLMQRLRLLRIDVEVELQMLWHELRLACDRMADDVRRVGRWLEDQWMDGPCRAALCLLSAFASMAVFASIVAWVMPRLWA